MHKFLLIDNHEIFKSSINSLINDLDNKNVVFEAENLEAAKRVIEFYEDIHIVVLNLAALHTDLDESISYLRNNLSNSQLLVITDSIEQKYVAHLSSLGAMGIISISSNQNDVRAAIRSLLNKQKYISNTILNQGNVIRSNQSNGNKH